MAQQRASRRWWLLVAVVGLGVGYLSLPKLREILAPAPTEHEKAKQAVREWLNANWKDVNSFEEVAWSRLYKDKDHRGAEVLWCAARYDDDPARRVESTLQFIVATLPDGGRAARLGVELPGNQVNVPTFNVWLAEREQEALVETKDSTRRVAKPEREVPKLPPNFGFSPK